MNYHWGYNDVSRPRYGDIEDSFKAIATLAKGASITDRFISPFNNREFRSFGYDENFQRLEEGVEYLVYVKNVNVHISKDQARDTALFGISGEEFIKCVDALRLQDD